MQRSFVRHVSLVVLLAAAGCTGGNDDQGGGGSGGSTEGGSGGGGGGGRAGTNQAGAGGGAGQAGGNAGAGSGGSAGQAGAAGQTGGTAGSPDAGVAMDAAGVCPTGAASPAPPDAGAGVSPFAYDTRPSNVTCKPPGRPTGMPNDPFPKTLKATGCVDMTDPTKPAAGVIPYAVNTPLWSDAAGKGRWMALPDGSKITVEADGDWTLPIGSVLMKEFQMDGKRIETRLLVRHSDGEWAGYSYRWREPAVDADLLPAGDTRDLGGGKSWTYPDRKQCLDCHTAAAGRTLGLETAQLNGVITYPNGKRANQLATLDHIGLFAAAIGDPAMLPVYPTPTDPKTGSLEKRARAYLQGNCSHCHRPGGTKDNGGMPLDLGMNFRYSTPLAMMGAINVKPSRGDFGFYREITPGGERVPVKIIEPGYTDNSMMSIRIHSTAPMVRMPQIGTAVVDDAGVAVIDEWITALGSCK